MSSLKSDIEKEIKDNNEASKKLMSKFDMNGFTDKAKQEIEGIIKSDYFWINENLKAKLSLLAQVKDVINKLKLPTDKDYKYSNEYIKNWMDELNFKLFGEEE